MLSGQLAQQSATTDPSVSKQNRYTCVGCRIKFETSALQRDHFKTEWHLYNLKRRVCNLPPIDSDNFHLIHSKLKEVAKPVAEEKSRSANPKARTSLSDSDENEEDDGEDEDGEWDDIDEECEDDWDEAEAEEMLARVVKSDTCLFCDKKSSNKESNVKHMNLLHGFFVPEEQYMLDLEGFLQYLGFKVGAGTTCLWCNKQFTSLHGVRLHMIKKDHCKIFYEQKKAVDEFKEFYDYSTQEHIDMKPINQLVIRKKRYERKYGSDSGSYAKARSLTSATAGGSERALTKKTGRPIIGTSCQAKAIKKFDSYRAKILLRTGVANNMTLRGRLRQQNPI